MFGITKILKKHIIYTLHKARRVQLVNKPPYIFTIRAPKGYAAFPLHSSDVGHGNQIVLIVVQDKVFATTTTALGRARAFRPGTTNTATGAFPRHLSDYFDEHVCHC